MGAHLHPGKPPQTRIYKYTPQAGNLEKARFLRLFRQKWCEWKEPGFIRASEMNQGAKTNRKCLSELTRDHG